MALSELLTRKNDLKKAESTLARLTADRDSAKARLETASGAWGDALADQEEGNGDAALVAKLEKALDAAQRDFFGKDAALKAAQSRLSAAQSAAKKNEHEAEWAKVISASEARKAAANELAKSMEAFAGDYIALQEATSALLASLPERPRDIDAALLFPSHIESAVRRELYRLGVNWAFSWPYGKGSLPEFLNQFLGASKVVGQWRNDSQGSAKS